jgi:hypothetical protein
MHLHLPIRMSRWLRLALLAVLSCALSGCGDPAPIAISYRQSLLDSAGLVMIVNNTGSKYLSCRMNVSSGVNRTKTGYLFSLGPHASQEIGVIQAGWSFKSGEKVQIAVEGHVTHSIAVANRSACARIS